MYLKKARSRSYASKILIWSKKIETHKQIVGALPQDCPRGIAVAVKEKSAFNFAWRSEAERWNFSKSYFKYALRISWEFFRHRRKGMETGLPGDGKGKLRIFVPRKSFQFT